ncbi:hypothetical protein D3C81_1740210 [compost metagenome]
MRGTIGRLVVNSTKLSEEFSRCVLTLVVDDLHNFLCVGIKKLTSGYQYARNQASTNPKGDRDTEILRAVGVRYQVLQQPIPVNVVRNWL